VGRPGGQARWAGPESRRALAAASRPVAAHRVEVGRRLPHAPKPGRIRRMTRLVKCAKLGETLPGLPYKPFNDALGQRIYDTVSAQAWSLWIEHSKKIVNEYRLDLTQKKAHEVLKEQCEAFLFGDGGIVPPDYVPEKH
jgi:Fe-S cluster biosynthesis and repair protein YggX